MPGPRPVCLLGCLILLITGFSPEQETEVGDLAHYVQKSIPFETNHGHREQTIVVRGVWELGEKGEGI